MDASFKQELSSGMSTLIQKGHEINLDIVQLLFNGFGNIKEVGHLCIGL